MKEEKPKPQSNNDPSHIILLSLALVGMISFGVFCGNRFGQDTFHTASTIVSVVGSLFVAVALLAKVIRVSIR